MLEWHGQEARRISAFLQLTIEPSRAPSEISTIPQDILDQIADHCLKINTVYGTPIYLRYGHEMNGDWTYYGLQPIEFKLGFQRLAQAIRKKTNLTAMVWGPNLGINYPFQNGGMTLPANNTANFRELDSNNDGVIDFRDDPYTPYYPGDDYVDWVGMSLYWYPDAGTGFNGLPEPNFFLDQLTSTGASIDKFQPVAQGQANRNFYQNFPVLRNKPMMIPESACPWVPSITTSTTTEVLAKQNWWKQLFSDNVRTNYPKIKMAFCFEETKADGVNAVRDWQLTKNPQVLDAFKSDLNALNNQKKVGFAGNLKVACNGQTEPNF